MKKCLIVFLVLVCFLCLESFAKEKQLLPKASKKVEKKSASKGFVYCVECKKKHVFSEGAYCIKCDEFFKYAKAGSKCQKCNNALVLVIRHGKAASKKKIPAKKPKKPAKKQVYNIDVRKVSESWSKKGDVLIYRFSGKSGWRPYHFVYFLGTLLSKTLRYPRKMEDEKPTKSMRTAKINNEMFLSLSAIQFKATIDINIPKDSRVTFMKIEKGFKMGLVVLSPGKVLLVLEKSFLKKIFGKFKKPAELHLYPRNPDINAQLVIVPRHLIK